MHRHKTSIRRVHVDVAGYGAALFEQVRDEIPILCGRQGAGIMIRHPRREIVVQVGGILKTRQSIRTDDRGRIRECKTGQRLWTAMALATVLILGRIRRAESASP